ncbi:TetR family transcriptional regulator C-terminal domain-containing protein [Novosphingobium taihuense]|uniref:AcrR family transcriptional regulator n=1 Tax=Novosphingobium taihuense TaxID=260085 RepID=A0A7W7ETZ2_9SPHN|nr:TetR family transcriptional regulator C-terminal domain-containing protein [Novosphingobium taihuense]MBB4613534.1 AcrR family transcriptional regulator [Novosphingobium taihuense]TWH81222.1 TetR family transcriptional regulator [Novosphingobium taihuense]
MSAVASPPAFRRAEPDARKLSLIEACARVLARSGTAGASVRAIAQEAGNSPGLVSHYFGGVDSLVAATYAHVDGQVAAALDDAVFAAGTNPRDRLEAFVTASFAPPIADPALLATWIAFWSLVTARKDIASQHDEQYAGYRARLEALLDDCGVPQHSQRRHAIAVTALVDGLWLELCLSPGCFTAEEARDIARNFLATIIS